MSTMPIKYAVPTGSARSRLLTALAARYTGCAVSGRVVWDGLDIHPASQTSGRFCYSIGKTRNNLSFNWRLIMAPEFVARYLVTHEAVHLFVPDHSKQFWLTVQSLCP